MHPLLAFRGTLARPQSAAIESRGVRAIALSTPAPRRILALAGISALICLGLLIVDGVRLYRAYRDVTTARATFLSVENTVLNGDTLATISAAQIAQLQSEMGDAQQRLHRASGVIDGDLLLKAGAHVPLLGGQVRATRALAALGSDLGDAGVDAVQVLATVQQARDATDIPLLQRVQPALSATQPEAQRIEQKLLDIHRLRSQLPGDHLIGPLASSVATLDRQLPRADQAMSAYDTALAVAPTVMGYNGARTYLVLARDSSELIGSGGYDMAYAIVTLDHGQLTHTYFGDTAAVRRGDWPPPDPQNYITPPAPLTKNLLGTWPMGLAEASWWLDFPTSAQQAVTIYHLNTRDPQPFDGVIGIDSLALGPLLSVLGPINVPQFNVTVTGDDVLRQQLVYGNPPTPRADGLDPGLFKPLLGNEILSRLQNVPISEWSPLASTLHDLVGLREIALYDSDPAVEQQYDKVDVSGRIPVSAAGDFVLVSDTSLGHSKMNLVVQHTTALDVSLEAGGGATDRLTLTYTTPMAAVAARDPELAAVYSSPAFDFADYFRVLGPQAATLDSISLDGAPIQQPDPAVQEAGHQEFGATMLLGEDESAVVIVTSHVNGVASFSGSVAQYRLTLMKQPGTQGSTASIALHPPAGWKVVSVALDGRSVATASGDVNTDLTRDRTLTVTLRRAG